MKQRGFTVIELMVTLAIAAVLLGLGIASFNTMMETSRARAVAESIMSGLRMARAEAIKRNVPIRFHLVTTLDDTCVTDNAGSLWVVTQADNAAHGVIQNHCGSAAYTPPDQPDICNPDVPACSDTVLTNCRGLPVATNLNPGTCSDDPLIAYKSDDIKYQTITVSGTSTIGGVAAAAVTFTPLGRMTANLVGGTSMDQIDIQSSDTDAKKWRIQIAQGSGSLRLCDPDATVAATSAQACR